MEPFEVELRQRGITRVAGLDEVGRGALFGPVVAAAVVLPADIEFPGVDDSKRLTANQRLEAFLLLQDKAVDWSLGLASAAEIDRINVLEATRLAMARAVRALRRRPGHLLIDALQLADVQIPQTAVVGGDSRCLSIAAASIVAKCSRDALIEKYGVSIRGYGLRRNKGYATAEHRRAIMKRGFSSIHRRTFRVQGTLPFDVGDECSDAIGASAGDVTS